MAEPANNNAAGVQHVALQLPPFLPDDPETWFVITEARFVNANITTSNTRFNRLVGHLPADVINAVKTIVLNPPGENPYEELKTAILDRFRAPTQTRAAKFLDDEPLGGRDILRYAQEMDDNTRGLTLDDLKRIKILRALPAAVRNVLAFNANDDYLTIARLAHAAMGSSITVVAAASTTASPALPPSSQDEESVKDTTFAVDAVDQMRRHRRPPHRNFGDSGGRISAPSADAVCYFHRRYGIAARKCEGKCSFRPNANSGRRM